MTYSEAGVVRVCLKGDSWLKPTLNIDGSRVKVTQVLGSPGSGPLFMSKVCGVISHAAADPD